MVIAICEEANGGQRQGRASLSFPQLVKVNLGSKATFARNNCPTISPDELDAHCDAVDTAIQAFLNRTDDPEAQQMLFDTCEQLRGCLYRWGKLLDSNLSALPRAAYDDLVSTVFDAGGRIIDIEHDLANGVTDAALESMVKDFDLRLLRQLKALPIQWQYIRGHCTPTELSCAFS